MATGVMNQAVGCNIQLKIVTIDRVSLCVISAEVLTSPPIPNLLLSSSDSIKTDSIFNHISTLPIMIVALHTHDCHSFNDPLS